MEPLTTNASVLTVVYSADGLRHVGGFELGIAPHSVQAAPQPPVEPRTRLRVFGSVRVRKSPRFAVQPF
jgi:hypothetical protein